jgi:sporulation protein YlmC with PRC-barrel domain
MSQHYLDIARQVLDRQVVDSNHIVCGKVDDIEIEGKTQLKVTAILLGNGAASSRLPELGKYISRKLFGRRVVRIPWSEVVVISHQIKLRSTARELGLDERTGIAFKIISALPSSWKK